MEGIECNEVMGAMYAFPQVFIPKRAQEEAKVREIPDVLGRFYINFVINIMMLLE